MMSDDPSILRAVAIGAISSPDGVVNLRIEYLPSGSESPEDVQVHRYSFPTEKLGNIVRALGVAAAGSEETTRRNRSQMR